MLKQFLICISLVLLVALAVAAGLKLAQPDDAWICRDDGAWVKQGDPAEPMPATGCGTLEAAYEGLLTELDFEKIKIEMTAGHEEVIAVGRPVIVLGKDGNSQGYGYLRKGFRVRVVALKSADGQTAREIRIIDEPNILVYAPKAGDTLGLPAVISGEARVFENTFSYRIKDSDGTLLLERHAMAQSPDAGIFGPFEVIVNYPAPKSGNGTVEVFEYSAKDGSEINKVAVPVNFGQPETASVRVFFPNTVRDPEMLDCAKNHEVVRRIPQTAAVARAALEELLLGPDAVESRQGFITSINSGVRIQSLTIENGTARADFDEMLQLAVGGSCRVLSISSQIRQTLLQFPTVRNVIISIDGRTEDILQP